jgi:dTDP-4-amino-4,6-dideoxygalactose transaminase
MFRYQKDHFAGLSRAKFLQALRAEGIPGSGGYEPLNREPFLQNVLESRGFQRIHGPRFHAKWLAQNQCPANDQLCREAVWFTQTMLLAERSAMDQIAEAVRKIQKHAAALA